MDTAVFATLKKLIGKKTDSTDETVNGKLNTVIKILLQALRQMQAAQ